MAGIRTDVSKHKTTLPFNGTANVDFTTVTPVL